MSINVFGLKLFVNYGEVPNKASAVADLINKSNIPYLDAQLSSGTGSGGKGYWLSLNIKADLMHPEKIKEIEELLGLTKAERPSRPANSFMIGFRHHPRYPTEFFADNTALHQLENLEANFVKNKPQLEALAKPPAEISNPQGTQVVPQQALSK